MPVVQGVTPVEEVFPRGGGWLDQGRGEGVSRATFPPGATLPVLGLVLAGAPRFTAVSHTYRATMRPVATADAPAPAATFADRVCSAYTSNVHKNLVIAVEWQAQDLATSGRYFLQVKATAVAGGAVEMFRPILVEVSGDAFVPDSYPKYGLLWWGGWSDAHSVITQELSRNGLVVYSEPNAVFDYPGAAPAYLALRPKGVAALSVNDYVVFTTNPPHYPFHIALEALADANDYWVRRQNGSMIESAPNLRLFDKTHTAFRGWFVDQIIERFFTAHAFNALFLDERNAGLQQYNSLQDIVLYREQATRALAMTQNEVTAAWTAASHSMASNFRERRPQVRLMGNGTLGADAWSNGVMRQGLPGVAGTKAPGIFAEALSVASAVPIASRLMLAHGIWSGEGGRPPQFLNATTNLSNAQLLAMKTFTGSVTWLSPGLEAEFRRWCRFIACYASLIDAFAEVDNNLFTWPWNHQEVATGSFGPPVEYVNRTSLIPVVTTQGNLRIRRFVNATVVINLGAATETYSGTPVASLDSAILPPE